MPEPVELPIDGELDLHLFHPRDVKALVPDYLDECKQRGISDVRIIHGKGTGALRETVHAILKTPARCRTAYLSHRSQLGFDLCCSQPEDAIVTPNLELVEYIQNAERILIFTGAGVSTASGIPDFRGPDGVWKTRRPVYYRDFMTSEEARIEAWDQKTRGLGCL